MQLLISAVECSEQVQHAILHFARTQIVPHLPSSTPQSLAHDFAFSTFAGPLLPLGTPIRKPFLNLRGTSFKLRMRPVPVVFLRLAFMPQLSGC